MADAYLLAMRCPVQKRRESSPGFRAELENLVGDDKGKGTSGRTVRPKVPRHQPGADCSVSARNRVMSEERREQVTRVGICQSQRATGGTR